MPASLPSKRKQSEAAKRLAASLCFVPDDIHDMSCSYTGDNPRNVPHCRKTSTSLNGLGESIIISFANEN
jgi:hypothetical protein